MTYRDEDLIESQCMENVFSKSHPVDAPYLGAEQYLGNPDSLHTLTFY